VDLALGPGSYLTLTYAEVLARAPDPGEVSSGLGERERLDLRLALGLETLSGARVFVTDYPAEQAALARLREDDPSVAARFELVVDGLELANGYYELGDPVALRQRFEKDLAERRASGQTLPPLDERLLAAMDAGLPECAGVALGFDRLLMLKLGASRLEEVMPFPIDRA
jgi:lysyl-tRNA synthetase class 2